jgi:DNA-binding Lrp family transcriptional regulator
MDDLDRKLLATLPELTRPSVVELARRIGVARATALSRLDRLIESGVIAGFGPRLNLDALGFVVTAFVRVEIRQGHGDAIVAALEKTPQVLEVHKTTGAGDLLVRVVAKSNADLHSLLDSVLSLEGVVRTETSLVLHTAVQRGPDSVLTPVALAARPGKDRRDRAG